MSGHRPFSLTVFLPGGDPDGLRLIQKSNWTGSGLVFPRALLAEARQRRELERTGVYVLLAPAEQSRLPRVYIGEGDPIRPRLDQHAAKKDFWTVCIAFTSQAETLNKAHVQYLEARLIELASEAKRCVLDNGNVPQKPSLSEADAADAEGFLAEMMLCFPVLGLGIFAPAESRAGMATFYVKAKGIEATGDLVPQGFVVYAGSNAVKVEVPSCHPYLKELRDTLAGNGVLKPDGDRYVFSQEYVFSSPSTAAGVVLGRVSNGRVDWKTKGGKTLKEIQEGEATS